VMADPGDALIDERLRLVLLCAHPRLSQEAAAALTLRLVLGVPTEEIARLFLVPTATMAARLTRARKRLSGERFAVPSGAELAERVEVVAAVAYLAFTTGYAPGTGDDVLRPEQAAEAIRLVRVLREVVPGTYDRSDLDALLALMLLQHSRRDARIDGGRIVLLPDQDRARWRQDEIREALDLLTPLAAAPGTPYLLQALVAAEHAIAPTPAATDWGRIVRHYDELLALVPSPVVALNRAVAVAEADGAEAGLTALKGVALSGHRLPAVRAALLARTGDSTAARREYDAAIALCLNAAEKAHLVEMRDRL
jgi:predicted RNA polymerase sigma factor